ncbi:MAG: peptidoglycan-binding protein, partial [Proteobacteria bacterium]|nr:peptidoglycan-binding protein [Pseudomonadota bacterium]
MDIVDKKTKIQSIVNVFETGSIAGDYGCVSIYNDGPNGIKQVTYGKSQTTEFGNLKDLIKLYIEKNGQHADFFKPYVDQIGKKLLYNDQAFISELKLVGTDPIMITAQNEFFDNHYWLPALKFCNTNKFVTPLAGLVIYDSYIHSGSILSFLRNKFQERVPVTGGN